MKPVFSSVMLIVAMVILLSDGLTLADVPEQISVATMPPVVVKTVPQSGDKNVDPSIREIRVTFSKDMMDGSWSWTQISDETFPKMAGKPRYLADKRTCVLPVKLEPGRSYVTWINSAKFGNFRDADGRSAVPYLLVFETAGKAQAAQGPGVADMAMGQPKRPWGPEQATGIPIPRGPAISPPPGRP